jgi:hypothetical protein
VRRSGIIRSVMGAPPLLLLLLLGSGCDGCNRLVTATNNNVKYRMKQPCEMDADCKQTCPQGVLCWDHTSFPGFERMGRACECRSLLGASCTTASDCKWRGPGRCEKLFSCTHYPGSVEGTCECRADCETARDCAPIAGCAGETVCEIIPWGDRGNCECASGVPEGGAP